MPRLTDRLPKMRKHPNGQAIISLDGEIYYLGKWGSKVSKVKRDQLLAEWLAGNRTLPPKQPRKPANENCRAGAKIVTIDDVLLRYLRWAKTYYVKNGRQLPEVDHLKRVIRTLSGLYGDTPADKFGPVRLKAFRQRLIDHGLARSTINQHVRRVIRAYRFAVENELLTDANVVSRLENVQALKKGKCAARETQPVKPVDDAIVEATLPHLPPVVADMVRVQRLTGMRPGEVCIMRPSDIDRSDDIWVYTPSEHKTDHIDDEPKRVCIPPRAQQILMPYLLRHDTEFCFDPRESERKRNAARGRNVDEKFGNAKGRTKRIREGRRRTRAPKNHYTTNTYRTAIRRACEKADVEKWAPNQLRHARATEVRELHGLEGSQVALSHKNANVTQVYAERNHKLAKEIARQTG